MRFLLVALEVVEKGCGDRELAAADLHLGGSRAADLRLRARDEAADVRW